MSTTVLGISAFYHDSAAAIVRDGEIIAAAQEERFSRKKHDPRFPRHAINYCLEEAFVEASDLDAIVFYDNPLWTWDRILKNTIAAGNTGVDQFEKATRSVLGIKMWVGEYVRRAIGTLGKAGKLLFTEHHMSHAASAFYPSPFKRAAIITLDGVGEWATTTIGVGDGDRVDLLEEITYPHSLGLLYSAITYFCGFKVNSGEYKLMGLAPYGEPIYYDKIKKNLIDIRPDGSYRLNTEYFGYIDSVVMTNPLFNSLFDGPPREPESRITRREMNLAASVQKVLEEVVILMGRHVRRRTGADKLVLAGGVALNCVANGKLLREKIFDDIWIQPAAGDAGGSLGAALLASHAYFKVPRKMNPTGRDMQKGSLLGPAYGTNEVKAFLERHGCPAEHVSNDRERAQRVAELLAAGKIVGYLHGRMEFGPRALGARSIIGDPRNAQMQSVMNLKIKYRESFRPFAPAVLYDRIGEYFEIDRESPYMLLVAPVCESRRKKGDLSKFNAGDDDMLSVVNQLRSDIPAVTHVDYSARIQSVHPEDNPEFHRVLTAFREKTGCGVLVNTSFNVRGEPIVCTVHDAYRCFMRTEIDVLVLQDHILHKHNQPAFKDDDDWRKEYELD
ncbi:Decarbamoylnovobiocin carbamoyltransferase [Phycisphaerae bacterium RAS1]|nr:Decarbamoylnovobiocin carbamoyltransferase [Phycisphaerae bacterium RAS1]